MAVAWLIAAVALPVPSGLLAVNTTRFRILQVSDTHCLGDATDAATHSFIREAVKGEQPDLVVFSGDQLDANAVQLRRAMLATLRAAGRPFLALSGNHDNRGEVEASSRLAGALGVQVEGGRFLDLTDRQGKRLFRLWAFDWLEERDWEGRARQRERFHDLSVRDPVKALAFVHMPTPEFAEEGRPTRPVGNALEPVSSTWADDGWTEALGAQGVLGIFAGHDHTNDYCVESHALPALCYAGYAGVGAYGAPVERRLRVIELQGLGKPRPAIWTWKRVEPSEEGQEGRTIDVQRLV
ncbi:hypothetical protein EMIHUDRAFT_208926 [Emiliania huxleyi CCMP1516]|uniref:Calcineurin-like phosphoesterase domain-containing protein n=2 Tax=Emiliania huxleyi TaxID=2903 RepID=A0A0D3J9B3_EMIH1|nr:hypothetical protein EMIHUDRAFT_208926 [Emiliania huxleyi CCMP1516]EOD20098.1 hypothetical protein EMIHUDRAFT_208926 [Emiliania huxleyi CCMP1516]|eukprot:XP_005772527.1 hypothetical protein EMIHUDRAFT_208926 [Emiliania huxleyi CCMP1516]